jgi:hypothetical protein
MVGALMVLKAQEPKDWQILFREGQKEQLL